MIRTLPLLSALLLFAGCDSTHKAPTETTATETAADTNVAAAPAPAAETPAASPEPVTPVPAAAAVTETPAAPTPAVAQPEAAREAEVSPAILFQKCAACHGNHAEKSALNQSAVIGEWDSKRIAASIYGYQDGTYGAAMKMLMQNQVKDLTRPQVEALSEYIANLYVKTH